MTDYVKILSRAVAGKASYEERRGVYERARQALVAQLRDLDPPLSESDITKQRLALEAAIREVEAQMSSGKVPNETANVETTPAKSLEPRASELGNLAVEDAVSSIDVAVETTSETKTAETRPADTTKESAPAVAATPPKPSLAPAKPAARAAASSGDPALTRVSTYPASTRRNPRRPSGFMLVVGIVTLVAIGGILAAWFMVRGDVTSQRQANVVGAKISDRVAQDSTLVGKTAAVAQTAYLVEENVDAAKGIETFRGSITWRIESQSNPQGDGPEKVIRGLVEIPDRSLKMLFTVRRNTDPALPASHTIELLFDTPPDFANGAVESIAGIRMKPSEQATGLPLASAAVRITTGYFLAGLSEGADDTNTVLLRDRPWMDVLLIYRNGRRAVLTVEKGLAGENAFNEAFNSWGGTTVPKN